MAREQQFGGTCAIFRVASLTASLEYYVGVLGFQVNWQHPAIASVSRGRCCIFLSEGDQGNPGAWVWIGVEDAGALHEEWREKGAIIRNPPENFEWAYEMQVADPDGNVMRFGSDTLKGEPAGTWLDMYGVRWAQTPGGGWTKVQS